MKLVTSSGVERMPPDAHTNDMASTLMSSGGFAVMS